MMRARNWRWPLTIYGDLVAAAGITFIVCGLSLLAWAVQRG